MAQGKKKRFKRALMLAVGVLLLTAATPEKAQAYATLWGNLISSDSWTPSKAGIYSLQAGGASTISYQPVWQKAGVIGNGSGVIINGVYHFTYNESYGSEVYATYYAYDIATGKLLRQQFVDEFNQLSTDVTYDASDGKVYGIFYNASNTGFEFGTIDYADLGRKKISDIDSSMVAIAADGAGRIWTISSGGTLYEVDKATGAMTPKGFTGVKPSVRIQSAVYDPDDNTLYWAANRDDHTTALYTVDTTTGKAALIGDFAGNGMFTALTVAKSPDEADSPIAPANVKVDYADASHLSISWDASTRGLYGGDITSRPLAYDVVRMPDSTVIASHTTATTVTDDAPTGPLKSYHYRITPWNGTLKGGSATSARIALGDALEAPYTQDFEPRGSDDLFSIYDNNDDGVTWRWDNHNMIYPRNDENDGDDWLLTPPIHLKTGRKYNVSFAAWSLLSSLPGKLEARYGEGLDPEKFTRIVGPETVNSENYTNTYKRSISVSKDGTYRLAIHALSPKSRALALNVDDISITEGVLLPVPDSVTALRATAGYKGALQASISFRAPEKDASGNALSQLTAITIVRGNGVLVDSLTKVAPGQTYTVVDHNAKQGSNRYTVVAYNEAGRGEERSTSCLVGRGTPRAPRNVRLSYLNDNSALLIWERPDTIGEHGGYVDAKSLKYNVYTINDLGQAILLADNISNTNYIVRNVAMDSGTQKLIYYAVSAVTDSTETILGEGLSNGLPKGEPYDLPFHESFKGGHIENDLWWDTGNSEDHYSISTYTTSDNDGGAAYWFGVTTPDEEWLNTGKIALGEAARPQLSFSYNAFPGEEIKIITEVSADYGKAVAVDSIEFAKLDGREGWRKHSVDLTRFGTAKSVVISFHGYSNTRHGGVYLDDINVRDIYDYDLQAELFAPSTAVAGQEGTVGVKVTNIGAKLPQEGWQISVKVGSAEPISIDGNPLEPLADSTYQVPVTWPVSDESADVTASVILASDENQGNNTTNTQTVALTQPSYPTTDAPTAIAGGSNVTVKWNAPTDLAPDITDDFESYTPWYTSGLGDWTLVDGDKAYTYTFENLMFPNQGTPKAYIVFNTRKMEIDTDDYPQFAAHSGEQYLLGMPSRGTANNDWLISPELSGDEQTVSIWARTLNDEYGTTTLSLLYSTTDNDTASFVSATAPIAVSEGWNEYSLNVPKGARYFAVRNISTAVAMLQLDDVHYKGKKYVILGYDIYRDGKLAGHVDSPSTSIVLPDDGGHTYQTVVVYNVGNSALSAPSVTATGINSLAGSDNSGDKAPAYNLAGQRVSHDYKGVIIRHGVKTIGR